MCAWHVIHFLMCWMWYWVWHYASFLLWCSISTYWTPLTWVLKTILLTTVWECCNVWQISICKLDYNVYAWVCLRKSASEGLTQLFQKLRISTLHGFLFLRALTFLEAVTNILELARVFEPSFFPRSFCKWQSVCTLNRLPELISCSLIVVVWSLQKWLWALLQRATQRHGAEKSSCSNLSIKSLLQVENTKKWCDTYWLT